MEVAERLPSQHTPPGGKAVALPIHEYLMLKIGKETYAIDIMSVQEIRTAEPLTRLAGAPPHVQGVMNLRGIVIPVMDMRSWIGSLNSDSAEIFVVLRVADRVVAIVVDAVIDVVGLTAESIMRAPGVPSTKIEPQHIRGVANVSDRMVIFLDIVELMLSPSICMFDNC